MTAYETILVGTDGSESSYVAVERAAAMARVNVARLVILCAYEPADRRQVLAAQDTLRDEAHQVVGSAPAEETLRTARERATRAGGVDIGTTAVRGEPVAALLDGAAQHKATLIVVGNRGLNTLAGRLLGSVPAEVARKADGDVLIVHTT
ncbi:universal stress protein [Streptomyces monticola]|uniref:Universal stress protein n=1 Tax=Streptomyces monticola TaxID=2666263 RepID=A0ABW2JB12_9ACTN